MPRVRSRVVLSLALLCVAGIGGANAADRPPEPLRKVSTTLNPTRGHEAKGNVTFEVVGEGRVRVSVELANATPRAGHGFHIHERGDCSAPDASSAGEHFNPTKAPHGGPRSAARHAGDLGNLTADEQGRVSTSFVVDGLSIGDAAPTNIVGRSVVLHAKPDDLRTQPSGDSGARIACGVIGGWKATRGH